MQQQTHIGFESLEMNQQEIRRKIELELDKSGEKERLGALLKNRLSGSDWSLQLQKKCESLISSMGGVQQVSPDRLTQELLPIAKESIPSNIKQDVMNQLKEFVDRHVHL